MDDDGLIAWVAAGDDGVPRYNEARLIGPITTRPVVDSK
jgi:hypothetical protein